MELCDITHGNHANACGCGQNTSDLNILAPMTVMVTSVLWQPVPKSRLTFILQSLIDRINFCMMF